MGDLLRSETMTYVSLTMTNDSAHSTINALGKFSYLHIVDLNAGGKEAPSKQYQTYKKRLADCVFWEKKLQYFRDEMGRRGVFVPGDDLYTPNEFKTADVVEDVQQFLDPIEQELVVSATFQKDNNRQRCELIERTHIFQICRSVHIQDLEIGEVSDLQRSVEDAYSPSYQPPRLSGSGAIEMKEKPKPDDDPRLRNFVCGVIPTDNEEQFRRMLYRISRGNSVCRFTDIEEKLKDPVSGEEMKKSVFWVVFLGQHLAPRIRKMCDILRATIYELPASDIQNHLTHIATELQEKVNVDSRTEDSIVNLLQRMAWDGKTSLLRDWEYALHREKAICDVFMKAHFYLTMVAIEGWVPAKEVNGLRQSIRDAVQGTGNPPAALEVDPPAPIRVPDFVPTFFRTSKFTGSFQNIVNTYGIPRYQEVNPGLFTIISFPFLFGVMYGDIGHGTILTIFGALMIFFESSIEKKKKAGQLGEIPSMAFGGRYVLFMMGMFGLYAGTVYNDCFSIPIALHESNFEYANNTVIRGKYYGGENASYVDMGRVYSYGVDYEWFHKSNELAFFNSMKMKMSVVFGVVQMTFGICLSLVNHLYFKDYVSAVFEFIPRILFLFATFGYMIFMIIYKWTVDWTERPNSPPNLIQTMISMFLSPGSVEADKMLYEGQALVQGLLLLVAFISVPFMLCMKPCIHNSEHKRRLKTLLAGSNHPSDSDKPIEQDHSFDSPYTLNAAPGLQKEEKSEEKSGQVAPAGTVVQSSGHGGHGEEFSFSDELIHNAIHTIEFVLGTVSNTASYLRLWALSLAHAQLAQVFWNKMIMQYGLESGSAILLFAGFGVWAVATFAVLLSMDVLECFLHALRLHWVEFQNKFYEASGTAFHPFTFEIIEDDS